MRTETPPPAQPPERDLLVQLARAIAATYGCPHAGRAAGLRTPRPHAPEGALPAAAGATRFRRIARARQRGTVWLEDDRDDSDARYAEGTRNDTGEN